MYDQITGFLVTTINLILGAENLLSFSKVSLSQAYPTIDHTKV
jgi:hypothetical protein